MAKSYTKTNQVEVPEAKDAMDRFKMEVANEIGVDLKPGYNGNITAKEAGSIGGEMVRKMIKRQEQQTQSFLHGVLSCFLPFALKLKKFSTASIIIATLKRFAFKKAETLDGFNFEKVKRKAAAQRRPAKSERKNRVFSTKRQAVWFEMQSISN